MKWALFAIGVYVGLTMYRIPHYYEEYRERGVPPEYTGPKYRTWVNGVEGQKEWK